MENKGSLKRKEKESKKIVSGHKWGVFGYYARDNKEAI